MFDLRGLAFFGFTGMGALAGILLAPVFGLFVMLLGGSFWLTAMLVMCFMVCVGAGVGALVELGG
jgi:hypothetical protein